MNYIIFKNKNSNDIAGLLISELPPISKPKMRTSVIKIDGVDGDIIEELGFESYTKTLSIGLTRNYNIDEIIKYFSGTGNVVFSNEPDKFYKATILEQIDYERLVRFKTAKVKFHIQPFKYKLNELEVTGSNEVIVNNVGLEESKPLIKLSGSGTVHFYLNDIEIFNYTFDEDSEVFIDSETQDAFLDNKLKNKNMIGEFPILKSGENVVRCENAEIVVYPRSRWL